MTVVLLLIAGFFGVAGLSFLAGYRRARVGWRNDVAKLSEALEQKHTELRSAQASQKIVRAIQEGTLGVEDLRDAGFDAALGCAPAAQLTMTSSLYQPFRRQHQLPGNPILDKIDLRSVLPGTELWVCLLDIHADHEGVAWVPEWVKCSRFQTAQYHARIRRLVDGCFELAVDPSVPMQIALIGGADNIRIEHVTLLRTQDRIESQLSRLAPAPKGLRQRISPARRRRS